MKCADCVFWKRDEIFDWRTETASDAPYGYCNNSKFVYTGDGDKTPEDGLGYWDCESYKAGFQTGENFGCIHFKEREDVGRPD